MSAVQIQENPARLYLDGIAAGSRWSMKQALESAARYLSGGEHGAESFPWCEVRYQHTAAVRRQWSGQFKPATVNKLLAGLRGVLKQTWRLGLVDADTTAERSISKTSRTRPSREAGRSRPASSANSSRHASTMPPLPAAATPRCWPSSTAPA